MPFSKQLHLAARHFAKLEKARADWDFVVAERSSESFRKVIERILEEWEPALAEVETDLGPKRSSLEAPEFREEFERLLGELGVPLDGQFPKYDIPPFKLEIDVKNGRIRLTFGRRTETTTSFYPPVAARWVESRYRRLVASAFDANRFARDLIAAYEVANALTYRSEKVQWGRPVSLSRIYELLTLRHGSRGEYSFSLYIYDLTRLRQGLLEFDGRLYEFGYSRDAGRSLLLRDQSGREERISSLAIYDRGR